jgi:hypothetical protein
VRDYEFKAARRGAERIGEKEISNKECPISKELGLLLHFGTVKYAKVLSGEACLTWYLEFKTWSLMPLGCGFIFNRESHAKTRS